MKNLLLILSLFISGFSQAGLIEIEFDQDNYQVNDTIYGQLIVSDFDETLGGFFAEMTYLPSNLSLIDWQFGSAFDFGSTYALSNAASLYLEEYTWSFDEGLLASLQGSRFMLASFSFTALTIGQQSIGFNRDSSGLLNFNFDDLTTSYQAGSFMVTAGNPTPVPAPATLLLFVSALILLSRNRKTKGS